jgi:MazG family protein
MDETCRELERLVGVVRRLLGPGGCPWDRRQTHESLRPYVIEEAFEVVDAIDRGDAAALRDELGDVALQVVLHATLAEAAGRFTLAEVLAAIADKLVRRHPHVFGGEVVETAEEVERRWDAHKRAEGREGVLAGLPVALPALRRAHRVGDRLARVGFDWPTPDGPRWKLDEEVRELDEAIAAGDRAAVDAELGDVLLTAANLARHHGVDAEDALREALRRFEARFARVEAGLRAEGREPAGCDLEELEARWQAAKVAEHDAAGGT